MQRVLRVLLPILVLLAAAMVARALMLAKPEVAARPMIKRELPVTVLRAQPSAHPVTLQALGEVKPVHRLVLQPEVSGRVIDRNPGLMPGGLLHRGEALLRVDNRDHATVVAAQSAALEQATAALVEERGRRQVAEFDWQANADKLSASAAKAVREPAAARLLENDAAIPIGSTAAEFAAFIGAEQKRWKPVIERARIKPD